MSRKRSRRKKRRMRKAFASLMLMLLFAAGILFTIGIVFIGREFSLSWNPEKDTESNDNILQAQTVSIYKEDPTHSATQSTYTATKASSALTGFISTQTEYFLPKKRYIEMKNILQRPELPTGCEATALTIVLNHLGYDVDKCTVVDEYLPKTTRQYSLNTHFIGNPYSKSGLGCYAPVIKTTAERYLKAAGGNQQVRNITGASAHELYRHVADGNPVICWTTIAMLDTYVSYTWIAEDTGESVDFYINEHATVLAGYDMNKKTVTLNDPWKGKITYSMDLFEKRYSQLGKQAVLIV